MDGKQIVERIDSFGGELILPLEESLAGSHELTVIVYNGNSEYPEAGICNPVLVCKTNISNNNKK